MAIVYNIHNNPERGRPPRHDSALPEKRDDKITLVLDLDETLVHCSVDQEDMPDYEIDFMVNFQNRDFRVYVKK